MGKRKSQDFQKTKLKVGRQLPKGLNITDTSFKSKQIITPDQRLTAGDKSLSALLKLLDTRNSSIKIDSMTKISEYVTKHKETLYLTFPDILSKLGKVLLESDPAVTSCAVKLMITCIKNLSSQQFQSFSNYMVLHLTCMMSHGSTTVKRNSLELLDELLLVHKKVVGQNPKILMNLLNMVSTASKANKNRKLDEVISSKMTSMQWRLLVFIRMSKFFDTMMQKKETNEGAEEENEIHWDGKTRLYLPLYENGLKPATIDYSWYEQVKNTGGVEFEKIVFQLVPILDDALKAEIPNAQQNHMVTNDVVLNLLSIKYLNIILQILNHIGEWAGENLNLKENNRDKELLQRLQNTVSLLIMSGFPYAQHDSNVQNERMKADQSDCTQLNLNICYLYTMCFLKADEMTDTELQAPIQEHLRNVFCACRGIHKSIVLIVKMSRIMMQSKVVDMSYKNLTLIGMFEIMENFKQIQHSKMLVSFFMELSLDYDFQYLRSTEGMLNWFKVMFQKVDLMMESDKLDLEFVKYVRQICVRKYPEFIENLSNIPHENLIKLLKCKHEELQILAIDLIMAMEYLPSDLFRDLMAPICDEDPIPEKISIRLIRLLHTRFSKPEASMKEKLMFVKFLLNVGCDTSILPEPKLEFQGMDFVGTLFEALGNTLYRVYPTVKWKSHKNIFDACLECLLYYADNKLVVLAIQEFLRLILTTSQYTLPVHVALAVLNIRNTIGYYVFTDHEVVRSTYFLMFSGYLYVSVLCNLATPQEIEIYSVKELSNFLASRDNKDLLRMMHCCKDMIFSFGETELIYTFRMLIFLFRRKKLSPRDSFMSYLLEHLSSVAANSSALTELWEKIFELVR